MWYEKEGAAMKKYAIDLDITKCISCGACSIACMDQNDFQVKEGQRPFRNVFDLEMEQKGEVKYSHLSLACMHCSDALHYRLPKRLSAQRSEDQPYSLRYH